MLSTDRQPQIERGLVSVILPVYNGAQYLKQAIDSVLRQTYQSVEIIAVDDGSTDNSFEVLAAYGRQIEVIQQANAGVGAARNAGMRAARGEFIAFLDQDDWWRPEKLQGQIAVFSADPDVGLVHTLEECYDEAKQSYVEPLNPAARTGEMVGDCFQRLLHANDLRNSSVVVRSSVLEAVGLCDLSIQGNTCQDYDFWLRVARQFTFACIAEPLTVIRLHALQGHRDLRAMLHELVRVLLTMQSEKEWLAHCEGRRRLATVYDRLATAYRDAGDLVGARRYYAKALATHRSTRQAVRFVASCLPFTAVELVRKGFVQTRRRGVKV